MESLLKLWTGYFASGVEGIAAVLIALAAIQAAPQALVLFIQNDPIAYMATDPHVCCHLHSADGAQTVLYLGAGAAAAQGGSKKWYD